MHQFKLKFLVQRRELKWLILNKLRRLFHSSRGTITFGQDVCDLVFGVDVTDLDFGVQINPVKQPIWSNSCGSVKHVSLWDFFPFIIILITASLSSKTYNMAPAPECIVMDDMWSMFVGMTLVCLNWMGLCMFGSVACNFSHRNTSLGCPILFGTK